MKIISIEQNGDSIVRKDKRTQEEVLYNANVKVDDEKFRLTVTNPASTEEEKDLAWYFEEYGRFPFTDTVRYEEMGSYILEYGENLFQQIFKANQDLYLEYKTIRKNREKFQIEIKGSSEFHSIHWESIKDPDDNEGLSLIYPIIRVNEKPVQIKAVVNQSATLNILVITARPHGISDVRYRTITRPLVDMIEKSYVKVDMDIVKPGSYKALMKQLESKKPGYYHMVHFDLHGGLLRYSDVKSVGKNNGCLRNRYGRNDITEYEGYKAYLMMESTNGNIEYDVVEASEIANLIGKYSIPVVILNACESAKKVHNLHESLTEKISENGIHIVLGMCYSVYVDAATIMMESLYKNLYSGTDIKESIRLARNELYNQKARKVYMNEKRNLEDWILPVVFHNKDYKINLRKMDFDEEIEYMEKKSSEYEYTTPMYGFFGRDVDILQIEKSLLNKRNILLLRGMGGCGKLHC